MTPAAQAVKAELGKYTSDAKCERVARAVLMAVRVPSVEAVAAFWRIKNTGSLEPGQTGDDRSDYAAFRAMIDALLSAQGLPSR